MTEDKMDDECRHPISVIRPPSSVIRLRRRDEFAVIFLFLPPPATAVGRVGEFHEVKRAGVGGELKESPHP
jgi:hypothetical protein